MGRLAGFAITGWLAFGIVPCTYAQYVVDWPPATGQFTTGVPVYPAPGAVGAQYVETYPTYMGSYDSRGAYVPQQAVPYQEQAAPAQAGRVRGRLGRPARTYSRGYNQAPAPYSTPLPQGQLTWPGSYLAPGYVPFNRYQGYGSGYAVSPYGSNFYTGYYQGRPLGY